jgi:hypothetical protein
MLYTSLRVTYGVPPLSLADPTLYENTGMDEEDSKFAEECAVAQLKLGRTEKKTFHAVVMSSKKDERGKNLVGNDRMRGG